MLAKSRRLLTDARNRIEIATCFTPLRARLLSLSSHELASVNWAWRSAQNETVKRIAMYISRSGNGALYVLATVILLLTVRGSWRTVAISWLCVVIVHFLCPGIKIACARLRPCELDDHLAPSIAPLNRHSFPSGHVMTLTAASVPILSHYPNAWPGLALLWIAMAWARVACAHHYPSDIVAGTVLGVLVGAPVVWMSG